MHVIVFYSKLTKLVRLLKPLQRKSLLLKLYAIDNYMYRCTMARGAGWSVMVSHRSGETEDTFIADLVVGLGTGQVCFWYRFWRLYFWIYRSKLAHHVVRNVWPNTIKSYVSKKNLAIRQPMPAKMLLKKISRPMKSIRLIPHSFTFIWYLEQCLLL